MKRFCQPHTRLRLVDPAHDPLVLTLSQDDLIPPDMLVGSVAVRASALDGCGQRLRAMEIPFAAPDSHALIAQRIPSRTQMSDATN